MILKTIAKAFLLVGAMSGFIPSIATASVSGQDALDTFNEFVLTVRVFDEFEKRDGIYPASASHKIMELIMSSAFASPNKEGSDCLLAGYVGKVKQGSCKPVDPLNIFDKSNNLVCSPSVFGAGVLIPRPKDSRWTFACANEVLKRAGVTGKTIDGQISDQEAAKIGQFLREKQGVSFANNLNLQSVLSKCESVSVGAKDKVDCDHVRSIFTTALQNYVPKVQPEVERNYHDCWKEWIKAGAKFAAKLPVKMSEKFDKLNWVSGSGCQIKSADSASEAGLKDCYVRQGAEISVKSLVNPTQLNLVLTRACTKIADGSDVVDKVEATLSCDDSGLSKVDFWMIRMMNRNFDLNPACKSDIRSPSEIKLDAEKAKKAK